MSDITNFDITYFGDGIPKPEGTWDYYGACAPGNREFSYSYNTFTLGIFQWVASKSGTKRGKVVRRIKGYASAPFTAFDEADKIVNKYNRAKELSE